jgi:hypothetical protein
VKCERAVELLATGTALGRLRARRHAARCPSCATEIDRLARLSSVLGTVAPLTAAQRALWKSASTEPRPVAARSIWHRHVRLAAAAAGLIVAIGLTFVALRPPPVKPPIESTDPRSVNAANPRQHGTPEMIQELDALSSGLHALSRELAELSRQAELLDERREAEALSRQFVVMNSP